MKRSILDRVRVVSPCDESWNEMRGNDEVRFCSHCAKSVHNLSEMTRRDAEQLVAKSKGRLCIRYATRADRKIITASDFRSLHKITRRASRIAAGAFSAALTLTTAAAQSSTPQSATNEATVEVVSDKINAPQIPVGGARLTGVITDPSGAAIPGVKVTVTDDSGAVRTASTDENGNYEIETLPDGVFTVDVEGSYGFIPTKITSVRVSTYKENRTDATLEVGETTVTVGMLVMTSPAESFIKHYEERQTREDQSDDDENSEMEERVEPLLDAASSDELPDVKRMLRGGASANERNEWGETPLMVGANYKRVVRALLKAGADAHARSVFGVTPLMYATLADDDAPLRLLLNAGADANARDVAGRTALMFAAMEGRVETVKRLLVAGAEMNARDKDGKSALAFAREFSQKEIVKALQAAGARE